MEQTQPQSSPSGGKITFGKIMSGMWKMYTMKPFVLSGIYLIVMIPVTILNFIFLIYSSPFIALSIMSGDIGAIFSVAGILWLLLLIISVVAGVLTLGGVIRAANKLFQKQSISIGDALSYAYKKIGAYIVLALRVFWYSLAWVLILFMILFPILAGMFSGGPAQVSQNNTAYAQAADFPETSEEMIEFMREQGMPEEFIPKDIYVPEDFTIQDNFSAIMAMGPLYGIIMFVLMIIVLIRGLKAFFSFYILFDEENISTKDALQKSITLTKGNIWRIIGYALLFGLILAIIAGIINGVVGGIFGSIFSIKTASLLMQIWVLVFGSVLYPLSILFYFLFYKGLRSEKGMTQTTT